MRELAEEGDAEAMLELGTILHGKGETSEAELWLDRAQAGGVTVPPDLRGSGSSQVAETGGWGTGRVQRRTIAGVDSAAPINPCSSPQVDLDHALRRADLALVEGDLERWVAVIVPVVRAGCRSPELVERIERALSLERDLESTRDREVASAVQRGRPTAGMNVTPSEPDVAALAQIAGQLISILEDEPSAKPPADPATGDRRFAYSELTAQDVYAGAFADVEAPEPTQDPELRELVRQAKGMQELPSVEERPPGGPPVTVELGPDFQPDGDGCNPSDESRCPASLKRPGAICKCCVSLYGSADNCYWSGGQAAQPKLRVASCHVYGSYGACGRTDNLNPGGWWVWRTEQNYKTSQYLAGVDEPVLHPWRKVVLGAEKPKGCTPTHHGARKQGLDYQFTMERPAGPFESYTVAMEYARSQRDACCASAAGGSKPDGCP